MEEGAGLLRGIRGRTYSNPLEGALIETAKGFRSLEKLHRGRTDLASTARMATQSFERAMVSFYNSAGWVTADLYFMRLNTMFAKQLEAGNAPCANPFSMARPE